MTPKPQNTWPDAAVDLLAKRHARRRHWPWRLSDRRAQARAIARRDLTALTPYLPQQSAGLSEEERERLEQIATRIGADFDVEFPPHDAAAEDIRFLRALAERPQQSSETGLVEALEAEIERQLNTQLAKYRRLTPAEQAAFYENANRLADLLSEHRASTGGES